MPSKFQTVDSFGMATQTHTTHYLGFTSYVVMAHLIPYQFALLLVDASLPVSYLRRIKEKMKNSN